MAIDEDAVTQAFIDLVRAKIGSSLSEIGPTGAKLPSVIKTRVGKQIPDYPYVVVTRQDIVNTTPLNTQSTVDENDITSYNRIESFMYTFRCFGSDSINIMNKFNKYFDIPSVLDSIRADTNGAVRAVSNISPLPLAIGGEFVESASFSINWLGYNSIEDPDSSLIETFTLTYN